MTTIRSSFSKALSWSGPRLCEFGAWPQKITACRLGSWSSASLFSSTASCQRETVKPFLPIIFSLAYCFFSQSRSTFHTRAQCLKAPGASP